MFFHFRQAIRPLLRSPGFTLVAVLSLALGIGANTAIFSLIDAVMLRSLPVAEPQELTRVTFGGDAPAEFTYPLWQALRDQQDVFSGTFAYIDQGFDLANGGQSRPVLGSWVTGGFFQTLGVAPAVGRLLVPMDDQTGCPAVAVLANGFWRSEYGGDPGVVGRTIPLNGHRFEIVGVAAAGFTGFDVGKSTQLFAPLCAKAILDPPTGGLNDHYFWFLRVVGRLQDGVTVAQADARLRALAPSIFLASVSPDASQEARDQQMQNVLAAVPAANGYSDLRMQYDRALLALMVVVGLVLLIACANVANLMLARAATRQREMAIRRAIGADRRQLVGQLLAESLLLAMLAAVVGIVFAAWASELLVGFLSTGRAPVALDLAVNLRVLAFTAAVAVATALLFGLAPAWRSTRVEPQSAMKTDDRTIAEGHSRMSLGKALVVGQITLSLVLVVAAGLFLGSFRRLAALDPGFRSEGVLIASLDLRRAGYEGEEMIAAKAGIVERLRAAPGVRSASQSEIVPLSGGGWNGRIAVDGFEPQGDRDDMVFFNAVSDGFFATMRTPLMAGREFGSTDGPGGPPVAIINEAMARKFFGNRNPLGESIALGGPGEPSAGDAAAVEVVGVVRDTKYRTLREETRELVYLPFSQAGSARPSMAIEIRADGPAEALIPAINQAAGEISPAISLSFSVLSEAIADSLARERLMATLSGFFGGLALLLAVVGLYGTMAYRVARRRSEIGIRMALGADRGKLMRMVLGEAALLIGAGLVMGAIVALLSTRLVAAFLYGLAPNDPATLAVSALILAVVALAAGALPAWRAARLDPVEALRGG